LRIVLFCDLGNSVGDTLVAAIVERLRQQRFPLCGCFDEAVTAPQVCNSRNQERATASRRTAILRTIKADVSDFGIEWLAR
jgi:hypothetical protein